ncbi:uncharacterized protein [Rutidosis leptorrhynchoides]|uniref:uncharacterized protein n=1 Tax=Rutidosis leptorrhynchoides TaxID=125765 RepID=UPI003A99F125
MLSSSSIRNLFTTITGYSFRFEGLWPFYVCELPFSWFAFYCGYTTHCRLYEDPEGRWQDFVGDFDDDLYSVKMHDFSDIWLEHLTEFDFECISGDKHDLEFIKIILAKSPALKKVRLKLKVFYNKNDALKLLDALLPSPRASPNVEIIAEYGNGKELSYKLCWNLYQRSSGSNQFTLLKSAKFM